MGFLYYAMKLTGRMIFIFRHLKKIQAVITEGGIQYLQAVNHYAIREKEPVSLAEKDIILETLRNKYDLAIAEPITLDQMKLIYYPMTTGRNETGHWMCDMIPAWQFRL